jgi:hypothetical protein
MSLFTAEVNFETILSTLVNAGIIAAISCVTVQLTTLLEHQFESIL